MPSPNVRLNNIISSDIRSSSELTGSAPLPCAASPTEQMGSRNGEQCIRYYVQLAIPPSFVTAIHAVHHLFLLVPRAYSVDVHQEVLIWTAAAVQNLAGIGARRCISWDHNTVGVLCLE
jgi:hypothetical protein